jgi:phosphatidylglycerol:prolipoprotein diacylglycerol transferase
VHPILFHAFGESVSSYTVANAIAYVSGALIGVMLARKDGRPWRDVIDGVIVAILSGMLGAKLFHTFFEARGHELSDGTRATGVFDLLRDDPWHWARFTDAGWVFYGGMIGATLFTWLWSIRRRIPDKGAIGDYALWGIVIGIFVGRIGCFLAGCCYGAPTDLAWGVHFPKSHESGGIAVHPVQLVDSAYGLVALVLMLLLWKKRRFSGEAMCAVAFTYAIFRFCTETLRADADRGVWLGGRLSTSQIVALLTLPLVLFLWRRALRLARAGKLRDPRTPLTEDSP